MDNNRFERIASALTRHILAKQMKADEKVFVVIDEDGANEVSEGTFNKIFANSNRINTRRRLADEQVHPYDEPGLQKTVIIVSPTVNATNRGDGTFWSKAKAKIMNTVNTMLHKFKATRAIEKILTEAQDADRVSGFDKTGEEQTYPIGYTIVKGKGSYETYNKTTKQLDRFRETSYILILYGISANEAEKIVSRLKSEFGQETVFVDRGPGGHYV